MKPGKLSPAQERMMEEAVASLPPYDPNAEPCDGEHLDPICSKGCHILAREIRRTREPVPCGDCDEMRSLLRAVLRCEDVHTDDDWMARARRATGEA